MGSIELSSVVEADGEFTRLRDAGSAVEGALPLEAVAVFLGKFLDVGMWIDVEFSAIAAG
jgi:hypothetical protein